MKKRYLAWGALRIAFGLIFLWAFVDKLFGLGFATAAGSAWIRGGSPTTGFLTHAVKGPFAGFYNLLAGNIFIDVLFMAGLLLMGLALISGVMVRIGSLAGALLMLFMWLSLLPPENNPLIDEHIIYLIALIGLSYVHAGKYLGFGTWWTHHRFVKKYPILE